MTTDCCICGNEAHVNLEVHPHSEYVQPTQRYMLEFQLRRGKMWVTMDL